MLAECSFARWPSLVGAQPSSSRASGICGPAIVLAQPHLQGPLPRPGRRRPVAEAHHGLIQEPGHPRAAVRALSYYLRDGEEIARGGIDPGVTLDEIEDVDEVGTHVVQLGLGG